MNTLMKVREAYPHIKPYSLVFVNLRNTEGYGFVGEVMSYPVDNGEGKPMTAMVRRAPGHSGTLQEYPVSVLERDRETARYEYVQYATVFGEGSFPVDMLRYDRAAPVNFRVTEEGKIEHLEGFERNYLMIATVTRFQGRGKTWSEKRWASFQWNVVHQETVKLEER